ncbi:MAG: hypothetical protein U0610_33355 [bacterium]
MSGRQRVGIGVLLVSAALFTGCAGSRITVQKSVPAEVGAIPGVLGVAGFASASPAYGFVASTVAGKLTQGIANSGHLKMFTRDPAELGRVVKELEQFQGRGTLSAASLNRLMSQGLEGIIFGEVTMVQAQDTRRWEDVQVYDANYNAYRPARNVYLTRTGDLTVNYKILDVHTGQVLVAQSDNQHGVWEILESGVGPQAGGTPAFNAGYALGTMLGSAITGKPAAGAPPPVTSTGAKLVTQLPAETAVVDQLATQSVDAFLAKIQPHLVSGTVLLKKSGNDQMELGAKYACACNWAAAEQVMEAGLRTGTSIEGVDFYNLAVVKELRGCRREAVDLLAKAVARAPDDEEIVRAHAQLLQNVDLLAGSPPPDSNSPCSRPCQIEASCGVR